MNGILLAGRSFIACRMAPTFSRSSFAGVAAGIADFGSFSGADCRGGPARRSVGASPASWVGLSTGVAAVGLAGTSCVEAPTSTGAASSSSVRFSALSIADIAAETGSVAEFCFAIASLHRRRSFEMTGARAKRFPGLAAAEPNALINHVAVYRPGS